MTTSVICNRVGFGISISLIVGFLVVSTAGFTQEDDFRSSPIPTPQELFRTISPSIFVVGLAAAQRINLSLLEAVSQSGQMRL